MEDIYQAAILRRDQLREELEATETFIRSLTQARQRRGGNANQQQADLFALRPVTTSPRKAKSAAVDAAMADAERMIIEEGRPLTRGDLISRLEEAGHALEGRDKSKVLGTNLWRSGRFWNLKGAGYWPKGLPLPSPYAHLPLRETMIGD